MDSKTSVMAIVNPVLSLRLCPDILKYRTTGPSESLDVLASCNINFSKVL